MNLRYDLLGSGSGSDVRKLLRPDSDQNYFSDSPPSWSNLDQIKQVRICPDLTRAATLMCFFTYQFETTSNWKTYTATSVRSQHSCIYSFIAPLFVVQAIPLHVYLLVYLMVVLRGPGRTSWRTSDPGMHAAQRGMVSNLLASRRRATGSPCVSCTSSWTGEQA